MKLNRKAVNIVGPISPEVMQELNLERELGKINLGDEVNKLQDESTNAVQILDSSRIKIGDFIKRLNELDNYVEDLHGYLEASYKEGASIDLDAWKSLLSKIDSSVSVKPELQALQDASKTSLDSVNSKRETIIKEIFDRNQDIREETNIYLTEIMNFDERVKRYFFKESRGFLSTMAELDEEYALDIVDKAQLDSITKEYAKIAIENKIPVKLKGTGIDTIHDVAQAIEQSIKDKQNFVGNVKKQLMELQETYDDTPEYDAASLEKIQNKIVEVKNSISSNIQSLNSLRDRFNEVRSKIEHILKTHDEYIMEALVGNIDKIADASVKNISADAPEGTAEALKEIVLKGLQEETKGEVAMSLDPKDTERILSYIAKKGKMQDKYLLALVYNHYVVPQLQKDIPELKPFQAKLPEGLGKAPNTLYGWVFDVLGAITNRKSFKETLRELMLDKAFKEKAIPTFDERYKNYLSDNNSVSKNEQLVFSQVSYAEDFFTKLFEMMSKDFEVTTQLKKIGNEDYDSFKAVEDVMDELEEKKVRLKEMSKILKSCLEKADTLESQQDPDLTEILEDLSDINYYVTNEIGSEIDLTGFSDLESIGDIKNFLKSSISSTLKDVDSIKLTLNRYLKDAADGLNVYHQAHENLDLLMSSYAAGEKGQSNLQAIEEDAEKVSNIIVNKTKELANTLLNFGIKNVDPEPVEEFFMSLNLANLYLRGPRGIQERNVPSGFIKKQELSKENKMNYKVNDLVNVNNLIGTYRVVEAKDNLVMIVAEDDLQSGLTVQADTVNESEVTAATDMSISVGDKIVDENFGECEVINTDKDNSVDIRTSAGVKLFDYPRHKLASKEAAAVATTTIHQCSMDNGWSISNCCIFSKLQDGQFMCGYKDAVAKVQERKALLDQATKIDASEEKKFLTLSKVAGLLEHIDYSDVDPLLKTVSHMNKVDPIFTSIEAGSRVHNRTLTKVGTVTGYDNTKNTFSVDWDNGEKGSYWNQELINVEAKELVKK